MLGAGRAPADHRRRRRRASRAHAELVELAEALGAPVYAEVVASTASFPASHPLFRGAMARLRAAIREVLEQHDVLFSVGGDLFTLSLPSDVEPMPRRICRWSTSTSIPGSSARTTRRGRDPRRSEGDPAGAHRGAARAHDRAARAAPRASGSTAARGDARRARGARAPRRARRRGETPMQPMALLAAIGEMLPPDAVVVDETISSGARPALAHAQRRSAELLRPARRRHRLGPAGRDRRQAGAARPAGGGADRRRQRDVHLPGAVDRRARPHRRGLRHPQQHVLSHPQAAPASPSTAPPRRPTAMWAWSWSIRRSITSASPARSA